MSSVPADADATKPAEPASKPPLASPLVSRNMGTSPQPQPPSQMTRSDTQVSRESAPSRQPGKASLQPDIDVEVALGRSRPSSTEATTGDDNAPVITVNPPAVLNAAAFSRHSHPVREQPSGIDRFFQRVRKVFISSRKSTFVKTLQIGQGAPLHSILMLVNVRLGDGDEPKVAAHLEALRKHKPIDLLESLYRLNLLFSRAKLYQLVLELRPEVFSATIETASIRIGPTTNLESTSFQRIDDVRKAISDYSSATGAYRAFRKEPGEIDSDDYMMTLAGMFTELDKKRSQVETMDRTSACETANHGRKARPEQQGESQQGGDNQQSTDDIAAFEAHIARLLVNGARFSGAGVRTEEESKERLDFRSRLAMALFGGAMLVVPMVIMSLFPSKLAGLLTTSLFVIGVAVVLAGFMRDAGPKDILAATAAYAAVLVVFVGTDGA